MRMYSIIYILTFLMSCSIYSANTDLNTDLVSFAGWKSIQKQSKNAVVQIITSRIKFDWTQPYNKSNHQVSRGSGFFIDNKGHLVTNFHVIRDAVSVSIQIPIMGKQRFKAKVVSICPERDLALLQLVEEDLAIILAVVKEIQYLALGDSDIIQRGDCVLAQGFPLGQECLKMSAGMITGCGEKLGIEIDIPINPGNSGGPLLDTQGAVIGIIYSGFDKAQNINYAIPVNELKAILPALYKKKLVYTPFFGEITSYSNTLLSEYKGNPVNSGIYIVKVIKNSLFDVVGIQAGDMLYSINGFTIDMHGLMSVAWSEEKIAYTSYLRTIPINEAIDIGFYRDSAFKEVTVQLSEDIEINAIRTMYPQGEDIDYEIFAGMVIMPLSYNHIEIFSKWCKGLERYYIPGKQSKPVLIISHIFSNSMVSQIRSIDSGFTIHSLNGCRVRTLEDFRSAMKKSDDGYVILHVINQDRGFKEPIPIVLSMKSVLKEITELAPLYNYPISQSVQKLLTSHA